MFFSEYDAPLPIGHDNRQVHDEMRPGAHQRLDRQGVCDINMSGRVESRRRMVLAEQTPQFRLMLCTTI